MIITEQNLAEGVEMPSFLDRTSPEYLGSNWVNLTDVPYCGQRRGLPEFVHVMLDGQYQRTRSGVTLAQFLERGARIINDPTVAPEQEVQANAE